MTEKCKICGLPINFNFSDHFMQVNSEMTHTYCNILTAGLIPLCSLSENVKPEPECPYCCQAMNCNKFPRCGCSNKNCQIGESVRVLREKWLIGEKPLRDENKLINCVNEEDYQSKSSFPYIVEYAMSVKKALTKEGIDYKIDFKGLPLAFSDISYEIFYEEKRILLEFRSSKFKYQNAAMYRWFKSLVNELVEKIKKKGKKN